jgi:hypothetical protein
VAAAAAAPSTQPSATTTSDPNPIPAGLAAAQRNPDESRSALWLTSLAAGAGVVLMAQLRRGRRTQHVPKHSMSRRRRQPT